MNVLKIFTNTEFGALGALVIDGKEFFPAPEYTKLLEYANPKDAIHRHCRWVAKHDLPPSAVDKRIVMSLSPEGDVHRLIVSSRLLI